MQLPTIEILFQQLASTLVQRSQRGIAVLVVRDDTRQDWENRLYKSERELLLDKARYTPENYQLAFDALSFGPSELHVFRAGTEGTIENALARVAKTIQTGWVTTVGEADDYSALAAWVKEQRILNHRTYKGVVFGTPPDDMHLVRLANTSVTFSGSRGKQPGAQYLPSLCGILAACNIGRGATNFVCGNLTSVEEPDDIPAALNAGGLVLVNDFEDVRVGIGINSLTTLKDGQSEDMKFIDIVETMDLIEDDIRAAFRKTYQGAYKNNLDNQTLFLSAVNTYFDTLARQEVLDANYRNTAGIDVAAQRAAWAQVKPEAEYWDDAKVRNTAYKRDVFLSGDIKINGMMENLTFHISIF